MIEFSTGEHAAMCYPWFGGAEKKFVCHNYKIQRNNTVHELIVSISLRMFMRHMIKETIGNMPNRMIQHESNIFLNNAITLLLYAPYLLTIQRVINAKLASPSRINFSSKVVQAQLYNMDRVTIREFIASSLSHIFQCKYFQDI